jgi:hypothetical protein
MSADHVCPLVQLTDKVKFYWSLLQTSVRLDRPWDANLAARHYAAEAEALKLGRYVVAGERPIESLADLREFLIDRIRSVMPSVLERVSQAALPEQTGTRVRDEIETVAEITALLVRGVDVRDVCCTAVRSARRRLAQHLAHEKAARRLVNSARELTKLACEEAERRLAVCISVCGESNPALLQGQERLH